MTRKLTEIWQHLEPTKQAAVLTLVVFYITLGGSWLFAIIQADNWGRNVKYYTDLKATKPIIGQDVEPYFKNFRNVTDIQKQRIKEQLATMKARAMVHLKVARDISIWSAIVVANASLASVVTGLCLVHIARYGWDKANSSIMGIFIVSSSLSILTTSFVVLYQYDRNIANNTKLYIAYINLEEDVLSALATQKYDEPQLPNTDNANPENVFTLDNLIHRTRKLLQTYNTINFEIDEGQIPRIEDVKNNSNFTQ